MSRELPKKYVSEKAVKRALKIDTFRNLSKDKIMQFVSMLPYMDKDVAIAIINQFPVFADFGKVAIATYMEMCDKILESNNRSQDAVIRGYQTILDALAKRLDNPNISAEEAEAITTTMVDVANKIAEADLQNKKFLERMGTRIGLVIFGFFAILGAGIGIDSIIGNGLPQVDDEDDESDKND